MDFGSFGHRKGDDRFDDAGAFVPEHLPEPGPFLEGHDVLTGAAHVAARDLAREVFEERGVYDATFGYNLARLDLDRDHPDAGFRYAVERPAANDLPAVADAGRETGEGAGPAERAGAAESADAAVDPGGRGRTLRAEFTPTTAFCPVGEGLALGAFRAFNGERDRHDYDLVRVRVDRSHQSAGSVNRKLAAVEQAFVETGAVPPATGAGTEGTPTERGYADTDGA